MAVFPESMDRLDVNDTSGSLSVIENYIRYMGERMEFSMRNMTRNVSDAGVSSAEMYVLLQAAINTLSALQSTVNGISGNVTSLSSQVSDLNGTVSNLQSTVSGLQNSVNTMQSQITSLEGRVTALETPETT